MIETFILHEPHCECLQHKVKHIHFQSIESYSDIVSNFSICVEVQLLQKKHHVQNQRNQALFCCFYSQMFSECFQLSFGPDCIYQSQATNTLHFNLVFCAYSLK